jgi:ribulose-5-phosphate 4-epimerase/fuculose-1-phosphate aldolase
MQRDLDQQLALQAARVDLAAACRLIHLFGWTDLLATHVSIRVPGRHDRYLINPLGLLFEEVTASSILEVDLEGRITAGEGDLNPAGIVIHGAIHAHVPTAEAVVHLHSRDGVAVATQAGGLLPLTQMALMVHGQLAYHDFQGVVVDERERADLLANLGDHHSLILRNHGTLTVGRNMGEAFARMWRLERACRFQIAAQSAGVPLQPIPDDVIARTHEQARAIYGTQGSFFPSGRREWAALLRKLDRELPGYAD